MFYIFVNSIDNDNGGFNFASIALIWIFFSGFDVDLWSNPLSGNLYQSKFSWRQDFMLCRIILHFSSKMLIEFASMGSLCHIDEINNNNTTHVSQPELSCYLSGSQHIHL